MEINAILAPNLLHLLSKQAQYATPQRHEPITVLSAIKVPEPYSDFTQVQLQIDSFGQRFTLCWGIARTEEKQ
ncbi:hypothetical protein BSQ40_22230 [Serratia fonticola]|jgi:hypothetical protein|nr:hypothetical protein BSQ40_22230 [Serratia fonticola]